MRVEFYGCAEGKPHSKMVDHFENGEGPGHEVISEVSLRDKKKLLLTQVLRSKFQEIFDTDSLIKKQM